MPERPAARRLLSREAEDEHAESVHVGLEGGGPALEQLEGRRGGVGKCECVTEWAEMDLQGKWGEREGFWERGLKVRWGSEWGSIWRTSGAEQSEKRWLRRCPSIRRSRRICAHGHRRTGGCHGLADTAAAIEDRQCGRAQNVRGGIATSHSLPPLDSVSSTHLRAERRVNEHVRLPKVRHNWHPALVQEVEPSTEVLRLRTAR